MNLTILSVFIGLGSLFIITGPQILSPASINWLMHEDPMTHYLGWVFFSQSSWGFPLGLNPSYGLDVSSSIVYSDSIPLFAIFFKALNFTLSHPFQYFGIWILLCFVLQFWFAQKIVSLFSPEKIIIILSAGIFLFFPPMLWRIEHHLALVGHFLILAALYLNINQYQRFISLKWLLLLTSSILIHFYLFAMVSGLWVASLIDRAIEKDIRNVRLSITESLAIFISIAFFSWQAGYWVISSGSTSAWGYGTFNFDLLSPFTPMGWSQLFMIPSPNRPIYDGINYIGLGSILLLCLGAFYIPRSWGFIRKFTQSHQFFILCLIAFLIFSVSNLICIGNWCYQITLPEKWLSIFNILRNSNRFFWPVIYSLLFGAIFLIINSIKQKKYLIFIFAATLLIQILDTSKGWLVLRQALSSPNPTRFDASLKDPFWGVAAKKYSRVIVSPTGFSWGWEIFADYAANYSLSTNSVYLARTNREGAINLDEKFKLSLKSGEYDPNSLYIIEDWKNLKNEINYDKSKDLLARVDGFNILAPGWKDCTPCMSIIQPNQISSWIPIDPQKKSVQFHEGSQARSLMLKNGWGGSGENWGTWASGKSSSLVIPIPESKTPPRFLILNLRALVGGTQKTQKIHIYINNEDLGTYTLDQFDGNQIKLPLSKSQLDQKFLEVEIQSLTQAIPKDIGVGANDDRTLSFGIVSLNLK